MFSTGQGDPANLEGIDMKYTVTRNGNVIANITSIDQAVYVAEQSFQCGISQSKAEIKRIIKSVGSAYVSHCLDDSLLIKIEAA